jgi:hypothetical protein
VGGQGGIDARHLWTLFEPVHAVTYFSQEARDEFERAGLRGFWRGYFAGRSAPLGPVGDAVVVATFFNFAPAMVRRAVPDVWSRATPERALTARADGAVAALRRVLDAGGVEDGVVAEAADLMAEAVDSLGWGGRPLGAVNAALPHPDDPLARLWQAATTLREHRGDGHIAALVAAGVTGLQALVWRAALDGTRAQLQPLRGWTDEEWQAAADELAARGWLASDGSVTAEGRAAHAAVEATTDDLAAEPWRRLGAARTARLADLLAPVGAAAATLLPYPNPVGVGRQPGR